MKEIALHILDIAENGINAGAGRVSITVSEDADLLIIVAEDDGKGMCPDELEQVADPFYTSRITRKVGLGIPLLKQHAHMTGGHFRIRSEEGEGTRVEAGFGKSHPDRQPLGDLEGTWILLVSSYPGVEWMLECASPMGDFSISSGEIKEVLGVENILGAELKDQIKRMIRNNIDSLEIV